LTQIERRRLPACEQNLNTGMPHDGAGPHVELAAAHRGQMAARVFEREPTVAARNELEVQLQRTSADRASPAADVEHQPLARAAARQPERPSTACCSCIAPAAFSIFAAKSARRRSVPLPGAPPPILSAGSAMMMGFAKSQATFSRPSLIIVFTRAITTSSGS